MKKSLIFALFTCTLIGMDEFEYLDGPSIPDLKSTTIKQSIGPDATKYVATFTDGSYLSCTRSQQTQETSCFFWLGPKIIGKPISNAYFDILAFYFRQKHGIARI